MSYAYYKQYKQKDLRRAQNKKYRIVIYIS